jgi:N-acetylglucosaminyldiphosphoundecaprenol N-acetyl-beta-D-mannosaminyltransferase
MIFIEIFSLKIVSSNIPFFSNYIINTKLIRPKIVGFLSMNEVSQVPRNCLNKIDFLVPDGMPIVWLMKMLEKKSKRIYGPDLMKSILNSYPNKKHYFYGSTFEVVNMLVSKYPNLNIVGYDSPPFGDISKNDEITYFSKINSLKPDFIWVSFGGKKQIDISLRLKLYIDYPAYIMPVGAAFDFISGNKRQAPKILRQIGLEWLFRLFTEPKRLWKRYILQAPIYIVLYIRELKKILLKKVKINFL